MDAFTKMYHDQSLCFGACNSEPCPNIICSLSITRMITVVLFL